MSSFGSIPHAELMLSLARRIVDARVLHLIKMWLECSVEETDDRGRKTHPTRIFVVRAARSMNHGLGSASWRGARFSLFDDAVACAGGAEVLDSTSTSTRCAKAMIESIRANRQRAVMV